MDLENPAVSRHLAIPPAVLEAVKDDPKALRDTARVMLMLQLDTLHRKLSSQDAPVGQKQAFVEFLSKIGDVLPKQNTVTTPGAGFSVQIVLGSPTGAPVSQKNPLQTVEQVEEIVPIQLNATLEPSKDDSAPEDGWDE